MFSRIRELLQSGNLAAVHSVENFGEMIISAMTIEHLLDLVGTKLYIFENGPIRTERSQDAIIAKVDNALVMFFHGGHELMRIGLVLGDIRVALSEQEQPTVGSALMIAVRTTSTQSQLTVILKVLM